MHATFMDLIFVLFFEEAGYDLKLSEIISSMSKHSFVPTGPTAVTVL